MSENTIKIASPVYLLRSSEPCWKCGANQEVVALATMRVIEDLEEQFEDENEPIILSNISDMPEEILDYIRSISPNFQERTSRTAGATYYMNTCSCGAHYGDFYLHSEPGGAFFPNTEEEARQITIEELPFTGTHTFRCGYGVGTGSFIFEHGRKH